jgi:hypothetical protein
MGCQNGTARDMNRIPKADGKKSIRPSRAPTTKPELDFVLRVSELAATLAPGVTLVGEKVAVQPLGNPEQEKDTAESNEPDCGITWIAYPAVCPAETVALVGDALKIKLDEEAACILAKKTSVLPV